MSFNDHNIIIPLPGSNELCKGEVDSALFGGTLLWNAGVG